MTSKVTIPGEPVVDGEGKQRPTNAPEGDGSGSERVGIWGTLKNWTWKAAVTTLDVIAMPGMAIAGQTASWPLMPHPPTPGPYSHNKSTQRAPIPSVSTSASSKAQEMDLKAAVEYSKSQPDRPPVIRSE